MKKLNITKGDWYVSDFKSGGSRYVASKSEFGDVAKVFGGHGDYGDQADANAQLIAEAGTIYNQAGLTPSELLKQRDELLEVIDFVNEEMTKTHQIEGYKPLLTQILVKTTELLNKINQ